MKIAENCVICNGRDLSRRPGIVTPFIADRVFGTKAYRTDLLGCRTCGFQFYAPRFDGDDLGRLYRGYRDEAYLAQRNLYEPWYTRRLNDTLYSDKSAMAGRRTSLVEQVDRYTKGGAGKISSILDFGGDTGILIDGIFNQAKKYVHDISGVDLLPGMLRADANSGVRYDLAICSNVLEHVPYPDEIVADITRLASADTIVYIEVPNEVPTSPQTMSKRIVQQAMLLFFRPRQFFRTFGPGMFTHMHEHINYYSIRSMEILFEKNGYRDISVTREIINNYPYICAFGRK